jgi:hypothetical protein
MNGDATEPRERADDPAADTTGGADDGAPPAARLVVESAPTEREAELERLLAEERRKRAKTEEEKRQREVRIAELEDELHRLRGLLQPQLQRKPKRLGPGWWPYEDDDEQPGEPASGEEDES